MLGSESGFESAQCVHNQILNWDTTTETFPRQYHMKMWAFSNQNQNQKQENNTLTKFTCNKILYTYLPTLPAMQPRDLREKQCVQWTDASNKPVPN